MLRTRFLAPLAVPLLALPAAGQLTSSVGPPVAPEGCPISITIANDTHEVHATGICPYRVLDDEGDLVFSPTCVLIALQLAPEAIFSTAWNQVNEQLEPVPPGTYRIEVFLPDETTDVHEVVIAGVDGGVAALGVPKVGLERHLALCSPEDGGATYMLMASLDAGPGIPTCGGDVPLAIDRVWYASQDRASDVFLDFVGTLDGQGVSQAPAFAVPGVPALKGVGFAFAYVLVDGTKACPVTAVSEPLSVMVE